MSDTRKALLLVGGWDGHEPELVAERFATYLEEEGFEVRKERDLEVLQNREYLFSLDLFVPVWTMGTFESKQTGILADAIASGVGVAGCHGGMCDAFRTNVLWQFIMGGNWVAHPGSDGVPYEVNIKQSSSPLVANIKDFSLSSEQYYLHVDPAVEVLATTKFPTVDWYHSTNGVVQMPVVWTKKWGHGRVYYNSLGHHNDIFDIPEAWELMKRGLLWAADGKRIAKEQNLDIEMFSSDRKMF
ncbi:MAG: ThuA domain-containing protein [Sphaerochaeta sp.]|uniref:ThuA domain-containing protein n=1 Tax=uncultured Sphaerochaeta sp. TaxID=886478 RepID=UPI002A0A45ED|nr:ThuA domain-containing protein [uncultured Sphaerochaeta sp.]MDY0244219.1 ThuA domain-containing protein [Sphaerochaeta sp.]